MHMNSWFHYAKLYAATAGCIGFMILKYHWGKLGKSHGFKAFPFIIVAINILIAVERMLDGHLRTLEEVRQHEFLHITCHGISGKDRVLPSEETAVLSIVRFRSVISFTAIKITAVLKVPYSPEPSGRGFFAPSP